MNDVPTPPIIYCPKCGSEMKMERIQDAKTKVKLEQSGYVSGARGLCSCGVTAVLALKRMPENPTFTLLFNIYRLEIKKKKQIELELGNNFNIYKLDIKKQGGR